MRFWFGHSLVCLFWFQDLNAKKIKRGRIKEDNTIRPLIIKLLIFNGQNGIQWYTIQKHNKAYK